MHCMKVRILRGANEIGGSCVEINAEGVTLLVDAGLPLGGCIPEKQDLPRLRSGSVSAIIISHPHLDHYGLLPYLPSAPVVMGAAARRILLAGLPYMGQPSMNLEGPNLVNRQPISIGPFRITPYLVDHSAYDAYSILIEAGGKRLFYSGDIRTHGRKSKHVERLLTAPPPDINVLLLEGSTLGRENGDKQPQTEADLEDAFVRTFKNTRGLALVHASAQNIDRIVSVFRACLKSNRTLLIDLYAAEILAATGNTNVPQSNWNNIGLCIPHRQRIQIKKNRWFHILTKHSKNRVYLKRDVARNPDKYVLLFRGLWMRDLEQSECLDGACLIHSQWDGYLKDERFREINAWLQEKGIEFHKIHTSGHAAPADLHRIATALAPKYLVPIHTDNPKGYDAFGVSVARHPDNAWWKV
jgi:ribonuclease J